MRSRKVLGLAAATIAVVALLGGCASTTSGSSMSRVHLYSSVEELAADSAVVLVGSVVEQTVAQDIEPTTDFTVSTVQISEVIQSDRDLAVGGTVRVRQIGSEEQPPSTPIFTPGSTYLLYLTSSGLAAPLDSQFYVTGANAGAYLAPADQARSAQGSETFTQVDPEPGENLPTSISLDDAQRSAN